MSLKYIRESRNLPFVKRGMIVEVDGKLGKITSGNSSGNINVRFDGKKQAVNCHPHWKTVYYDSTGNIIEDFR